VGIAKLVEVTAGHPGYLQVLGEELCARAPQRRITGPVFKEVLQETLFGNAGRLALYFSAHYVKVVKSSTSLARTLSEIAVGHHRVTEIARAIGHPVGVVGSWLSRLLAMDVVEKTPGGYAFQDPAFGLWIRGTKTPERATIATSILGDHVEKQVAAKLGAEGFNLVYQARASRGAFDLLAVLDRFMIGIQVKKTKTSFYYVSEKERERMLEWGKRLGWKPVLCLYLSDNEIGYMPAEELRPTKRGYKADLAKASASLLSLV
jgi:Holliday junction resolvase